MLLILTGQVHSGKTSRLRQFASDWRARGIALDGYLSPAVFKSGKRLGYDWLDLATDFSAPFLRRRGEADWERVGPYFVIPSTMEKAKRKISTYDRCSWLIVDEIGPLELRGGGVWPALAGMLAVPTVRCLAVVREDILDRFRRVAPVRPDKIFALEGGAFSSDLARTILACRGPEKDFSAVSRSGSARSAAK